MKYIDLYSRLQYETAIIIFYKRDNSIRVMLGTRCYDTLKAAHNIEGDILYVRDNKCNVRNGNLALIDLEIPDARSFNIDRLVSVQFLGEIKTKEQFDNILSQFNNFKVNYLNSVNSCQNIENDENSKEDTQEC